MQTWSLEIKKSHMGLVRWVQWMFQHGDLVLCQKLLDRQGVVCRCIVLVKNPWAVLPHFRSSSSHPFMKVCQNLLVVSLVNGLTSRHPIHVNNPSDVGKNDHHCFKFRFALPCFLLPWWTGALPVHGLALTFWIVLKKQHDSSQVIRFSKKFGSFQCFEECQHKCSFEFPFVQEWGVLAPSSNTLFSRWNYVKSVEQFPCQW